jgi:hypothetical protein
MFYGVATKPDEISTHDPITRFQNQTKVEDILLVLFSMDDGARYTWCITGIADLLRRSVAPCELGSAAWKCISIETDDQSELELERERICRDISFDWPRLDSQIHPQILLYKKKISHHIKIPAHA